MTMSNTASVFNIQHFCTDDGPGIRTTVFFKGCNLRCFWCHNPESQNINSELQFFEGKCVGCGMCMKVCPVGNARFTDKCSVCGQCVKHCYAEALMISGYEITLSDMMEEIKQDIDLYNKSGGGVTFSGGEPLLQHDFLLYALKECKNTGIHTALETALCVEWDRIESILPYTDLIFCDMKAMDDTKHKKATGVSNKLILDNISKLSGLKTEFIVRIPVIPTFNEEEIPAMADFIKGLPHVPKIELLPFHGMCVSKYDSLNRVYEASDLKTPSDKYIEELYKYFEPQL